MTIYLDTYFFTNLIADYLLMCFSNIIINSSNTKKILAALLGSIYSCLFLFLKYKYLYSPPVKIFVFLAMCSIVALPCSLKKFIKLCIFLLFISMILSGFIYSSISFFDVLNPRNPLLFKSHIKLLFCIYLTAKTIKKLIIYEKQKQKHKSCYAKIFYKDKSVTSKGFLDTGNSLIDPITKSPVIIVDLSLLKELFASDIVQENLCEVVEPDDFKIIPFKTIDTSGVIYGFVADKVEFDDKVYKNIIIGVAPAPLKEGLLMNPALM